MHYYQHHIGDYQRDTKTLSILEHGAYRLLMDECYVTERPLPTDAAALWRICGAMTKVERLAVSVVVEKFFRLVDGGLRHKRVDVEIRAYHGLLETASKAGRASAEARQRKLNARSTPVQRPLDSGTNGTSTNHEPVTSNQEPEREHARAPEILPRGCGRRKPQGWPATEAQAREMAEKAGVNADLAGTFWHHYDGMGYWPQGSFASAVKAKQGFKEQDLAEKERLAPKTVRAGMVDKAGTVWTTT